jgi:hypothetical protein
MAGSPPHVGRRSRKYFAPLLAVDRRGERLLEASKRTSPKPLTLPPTDRVGPADCVRADRAQPREVVRPGTTAVAHVLDEGDRPRGQGRELGATDPLWLAQAAWSAWRPGFPEVSLLARPGGRKGGFYAPPTSGPVAPRDCAARSRSTSTSWASWMQRDREARSLSEYSPSFDVSPC